jgi:Holliday junction DNA helicase RuvA
MIGELHGQIINQNEKTVTLLVGGVGYLVYASAGTLSQLAVAGEQPVRLLTHLVVREEALDLYGFLESAERDLFRLLIGVSGIGPRSAISILSLAPTNLLVQAIRAGKTEHLTRVSGIGAKNAQKIILELKDKLGAITDETSEAFLSGEADALAALQSLGYNLREAREALQRVPDEITGVDARIKAALQQLSQ